MKPTSKEMLAFQRKCEIGFSYLTEKAIKEGLIYGFYYIYNNTGDNKYPVMCVCIARISPSVYCRTNSLCATGDTPNKIVGRYIALKKVMKVLKDIEAGHNAYLKRYHSPKALKTLLSAGLGDPYCIEYPVLEITDKEDIILKKREKTWQGWACQA